ncbi:WSSV004 [White spot syndrome virus]|uniref:WSSV004 n=1 Tax=White spot syndrome virus TaxID=342409 RepID=A0A2I6SBE8_9VIRU|nr:WSSV004 [White spot syndrome virus]
MVCRKKMLLLLKVIGHGYHIHFSYCFPDADDVWGGIFVAGV